MLALIIGTTAAAFPFERITNFSSTIGVNKILRTSQTIWVATTGGVFTVNPQDSLPEKPAGFEHLPDQNCTALELGPDNSLWIGTAQGYLYRYALNTLTFTTNASYMAAGWDIRDMLLYGPYLIIASSRGCSIFDRASGTALKNAVKFNNFVSSRVNAIKVLSDTLYLGCENGVAILDLSGNKLASVNFNDLSIWYTRATVQPVVALSVSNGAVIAQYAPSEFYNNRWYTVLVDSLDSAGQTLSADSVKSLTLPSRVTCLVDDQDQYLWIGTAEDYLFYWNGAALKQVRFPDSPFQWSTTSM